MNFCEQCNNTYDINVAYCPIHGRKLIKITKEEIVGRVIDNKYEIEAEIGLGGTGTIYRARHVKLDMTVAIKILHPKLTVDSVAVERFRREAYAAMQIRHLNAIAVMDFGITDDNLVYVVMEFLMGVTLRQRMNQKRHFSLEEANAVIQPVCEAVHVAHKVGIIHRDLKPENIFFDRDSKGEEIVKVLDFGIAHMTGYTLEQQKRAMRLTQDGILIGTPHYMSPEQCYGRDVDSRSDVYALGIILYEMLTGVLPFDDPSISIVAVQQAREKPTPPNEIRKDIPAVVNAVVLHALEKKPENRPASMTVFAQEFQAALKVINEKEFVSAFRNASDKDLEAALLLANNPLEKLDQRRLMGRGETRPLPNNISNPHKTSLLNRAQPRTTTYLSLTEQELIVRKVTENLNPLNEAVVTNVEVIEKVDTQLLYEQLLHLTKETPILMQIISADLEAKTPIDMLFLHELKVAITELSKVIYQLEQIAQLQYGNGDGATGNL